MTAVAWLRRTIAIAFCAAAVAVSVSGQTQVPGDVRETFRLDVDMSTITLTVRNFYGRLVTDLNREDFRVLVDRRPVPIVAFTRDSLPLTVAVMIHTWMDVMPYDRLRAVGHALVNALDPKDQGAIGSFSQEVAISPFITSDHHPLHRVIDEELWGGNGNPLGSALDLAASAISTAHPRRVVIVVGTHVPPFCFLAPAGFNSCVPLTAARTKAFEQSVRVYGIQLKAPGFDDGQQRNYPGMGHYNPKGGSHMSLAADDSVRRLAYDTAGGYLELRDTADIQREMTAVIDELRREYVIGFPAPPRDGKQHTTKVELTRSGLTAQPKPTFFKAGQ